MPVAVTAPRKDPYAFHPEDVTEPPHGFWPILRKIGPGMILAASIVGSGELIATTTLGAQVGYVALWLILFSCFIKPVVQAEMGRFTIATGETGLQQFDSVPGPRWKVNWIVWAWAFMVSMTLLQIGAMFGGVSQVMNMLFPAVPVNAWVLAFYVLTLVLLLGGGYERIEKLATLKVALFTMLTVLCALLLVRRPEYFAWERLVEGFQFQMPGAGLATAVAVFGITGVGATELVMYPYWCVEKGYARYAGKPDGSPAWRLRALGWVRVMHVDIICSMIIYTLATIAFYLLGAGILHGMGLVPAANDMIRVISNIYTEILGPWSLPLFLAGAIATLYGTIFAATAAHSRVFADMVRLMGYFDGRDYATRVRYRKKFVVALTTVPMVLFLFVQSPVLMVVLGGIAQSAMLPIIAIATLFIRYRRMPAQVAPPWPVTFMLWAAAVVMLSVVVLGLAGIRW
jgi:Mn2+/Fe2+ NRAMP family transporter